MLLNNTKQLYVAGALSLSGECVKGGVLSSIFIYAVHLIRFLDFNISIFVMAFTYRIEYYGFF
jgi:hypothetical protein